MLNISYENVVEAVNKQFDGYNKIENLELNEQEIITDFLQYGFNDGIEIMAHNMANKQTINDLNNPKYAFMLKKTKKVFEKQKENGFEYNFDVFSLLIKTSVKFIYKNYNILSNYGLISKDGTSLFGFNVGKTPLDLKTRIEKFSKFEGIIL